MNKNNEKKQPRWTLNADVGEGCDDGLVMPYLDCANVACGAHAGDEETIRRTLSLAKWHNVKAGAHPGYPDKANFGRKSMPMSSIELADMIATQVRTLLSIADDIGILVEYVKPHGALNHDMLNQPKIFEIICQVVSGFDGNLALMVPTNADSEQQMLTAEQHELNIWWEVFADRNYEPNGRLRSREFDDAVHQNPETIIAQIQRIRDNSEIIAVDGTTLNVSNAQTICVHGDNVASVEAIRQLHQQQA